MGRNLDGADRRTKIHVSNNVVSNQPLTHAPSSPHRTPDALQPYLLGLADGCKKSNLLGHVAIIDILRQAVNRLEYLLFHAHMERVNPDVAPGKADSRCSKNEHAIPIRVEAILLADRLFVGRSDEIPIGES